MNFTLPAHTIGLQLLMSNTQSHKHLYRTILLNEKKNDLVCRLCLKSFEDGVRKYEHKYTYDISSVQLNADWFSGNALR